MEAQATEGRLLLVAVDESTTAIDAFEKAAAMLRKEDRLRIIHVIDLQEGIFVIFLAHFEKEGSFDPLYKIDVQVWNFAQKEKAKKLEEYYTQTCTGKKVHSSWNS